MVSNEPKKRVTDRDREYNWETCEDTTCCPPIDGPYKSSFGFRRARLDEEMSFALQMLTVFGGIALALGGIIAYTLFRLGKEIKSYLAQRKKSVVNKFKRAEDAGSTSQKMKNEMNDYEDFGRPVDTSKFAENKDDQKKFQDGIQKTIKDYKEYNQKVKRFFETKDAKAPDVIDTRILDRKYDEWSAEEAEKNKKK